MTVDVGHTLSHQISAEIEVRLAGSHILVHIDPGRRPREECGITRQERWAAWRRRARSQESGSAGESGLL